MRRHVFTDASFAAVALAVLLAPTGFVGTAAAQDGKAGGTPVLPVFEVDSNFPTMPDHMLLGGVGGATADSHGNVWVFQRPHTLEEGNATENGYVPAPPVLEFSDTGRYIQGWGGLAKGASTSGSIAAGCTRPLPNASPAPRNAAPMAMDVPGAASTASPSMPRTMSG